MMLFKLLQQTDCDQFEPIVIELTNNGRLGERIKALNIPVYRLHMVKGLKSLWSIVSLRKIINQLRPDIIQAWTYHSNIVASLVNIIDHKSSVIWNIRHTPYNLNSYSKLTYLVIKYGAFLSRQPVGIIYNSFISAKKHKEIGYKGKTEVIIPNGFDLDKFTPSVQAYFDLRVSLGLLESSTLIGMIARYHPIKDHKTFLQAASKLHKTFPAVHFVLVGRDVDENNYSLRNLITDLDLDSHVHLLGERTDIEDITSGFDIASLSSSGEAFPNVIGEAMACGIPCVVTDVGDSALVVGDTGFVVKPRDPDDLCQAWETLLRMDREVRISLGKAARERILSRYSLSDIVRRYETFYIDLDRKQ